VAESEEPEQHQQPPVEEEAARAHDDAFVERQREHRLDKLEHLRGEGIEPYPVRFDRDALAGELHERFDSLEAGQEAAESVKVAGRLMLIRRHGGAIFADLHDRSGKVQLLVSLDDVGERSHHDFSQLDLGDWVGAEGTVLKTRRGELSVKVADWELLSKNLRALPDKTHGLTDVDTRYRQRYLDLIVNEDSRRVFSVRSKVIDSVRQVLRDEDFVEVETPVLDTEVGGAAARPFTTHHNALDIDLYMRIALELHLKRLIVGGMDRVFEIGRVFRNEGLDPKHNPEFTLLEAYQALGDYHEMMDLVEKIVTTSCQSAAGKTAVEVDGKPLDLGGPFRRATMAELIEENADGAKMHPSMPIDEARTLAEKHGIEWEESWGAGRLMNEVYDATCEDKLHDPTFVLDHPREVSPLARAHRDDPALTERFELVVAGRELANAYSELNDPIDQRERFEAQSALRAAGDEEAEHIDEDYIRALEYGLPPTGGLGIGIDRLVMLVAEVDSIRDVILFPTMRPTEGATGALPAAGGHDLPVPQPVVIEPPPPADGDAPDEGAAAPAPPAVPARAPRAATRSLALLTALLGLISFVPVIPPFESNLGIFENLLAREGRVVAYSISVVLGLGLLLVARQLARGKRGAWVFALVVAIATALVHLFKGPDPLLVLYGAGLAFALVWWRDAFVARPDPRSLFALARFVPLYLLAVLLYGAGALLIKSGEVDQPLSVGGVLETVYGGLLGIDGPYSYSSRFLDDFFPLSLLALGIAGLVVALYLLLRPIVTSSGPTGADRERARQLVRAYGSDTLAYFALREDKSYFFSSDGRALIAYSYIAGYALVSADPVGAPGSISRVLDEFLGFCRERAWHIAFLAVREESAPLYRERGFRSVYMGEEAMIRCDRFSLNSPGMKALRGTVNRVAKDHHFQLLRESDATPALVKALNTISSDWREGEAERGFTMATSTEVEGVEDDFLLAVCFDRDERPVGFLRLVPSYGEEPAYSLDLMRREPDAINGVTEFVIARAAETLGARGYRRLSMNFAAWGRLFQEGAELSLSDRALRFMANRLNPYFQIRSLFDFSAKFDPDWLARSIIIEDSAAIPRVGLLYASVEGFVDLPLVGRFLVPQVATADASESER